MKLRELLRTDLEDLEDYVPVKPLDVLAAEIGLPVERLVKLDANENLYGPHPEVLEAIRSAPFHIYPDPGQQALREAIARFLDVEAENVVAGTGADDLLDILIRLVMPKAIAIPTPTFGMYRFLAKISRAKPIEVPRRPNFDLDVVALKHAVQAGAGIVFLTSPNNPTGNPVNRAELEAICALDTLVVVDEAYIEFRDPGTPTALELIGEYENLAVSRTMSKAFAFAGARVGYLAANKGIIDCVRIVRMPYHLSAVTQAAALAAFEHTDEQLSRVAHLRETRNATSAWLKEQTYKGQPLEVAETQSNFILFGGHFDDRDRIFDELLKRGVLIRVVGPEGWMRVCMGTDEEMARFREALVEVLRIVEQG